MKTGEFDYYLPIESIAQQPVSPRDTSRLMVVDRRGGQVSHYFFHDLPDLLYPGDLLVLNETQVIPARLRTRRYPGGGSVEVLLVTETQERHVWKALVRPVRKVKRGDRLLITGEKGWFEVGEKEEYGLCLLRCCFSEEMNLLMAKHGETPLPPYIKRKESSRNDRDRERYQTIYAHRPGSIAAPTAGLHFTPEVLARLAKKEIETCFITLHVGLATFQPLRVNDIEKHPLSQEKVYIPTEAAEAIQRAKKEARRVIAVGTTSTRALESSAAHHQGMVVAGETWADLYIYPPYRFQVIQGLITNFHLPRSSLLILVASFGGRDLILDCYRRAIQHGYRFYSYGDCMAVF